MNIPKDGLFEKYRIVVGSMVRLEVSVHWTSYSSGEVSLVLRTFQDQHDSPFLSLLKSKSLIFCRSSSPTNMKE
jgi:hypothetical protein